MLRANYELAKRLMSPTARSRVCNDWLPQTRQPLVIWTRASVIASRTMSSHALSPRAGVMCEPIRLDRVFRFYH